LVTQLVAGYVDRLNRGTEIDPEEIRREYPDLADEILSQLEVFVGIQAGVSGEGGRSVIGDYVLKRRVGRGGMGVVYDAWQTSLERRVALKVLPAGIAADGRVLQRFMREARTAAKLSHPHIVSVYGMGIEADTPYFAMEYVEGETLAQMIAARREAPKGQTRDAVATPFGRASEGQLYYTRVAAAFAAVADALYHAHASGVVHRDIKPSNLIFDGESRLRILDFGLAHMEGQESLTHTGDFLGTPVYMSPEQAMAKRIPVDHRTDIYSLGATLYEVLCVRPPFQGKDVADTLSQIMLKEPRQLRDLDPRVPRDLETIVLKCLQKDPGDRYGTAEALAQDLRRFVRGEPIEARPQSAYERLTHSAWRHKGRLAVAAVTLLCVVTASLLGVSYARQLRAQKEARYAELVRDAVLKRELGRLTREGGGQTETDPFESMYDIKDSRAVLGMDLLSDARKLLDEAIALLPQRTEGYYHRAATWLLLERQDQAVLDLAACLRRDPKFAAARGLLSALPDVVVPGSVTEAIGEGEHDAAARMWRAAYTAKRESRWQDAAKAYGALLERERPGQETFPGASIETRLGRALACLVSDAYLDAYADLSAARALWPAAIEPELLLGKVLLQMNEPERAGNVFERLSARPLSNRDDVLAAICTLWRLAQKPEEAIAWADRINQIDRRERTRAASLLEMRRFDDALESYVKAVKAAPGEPSNFGFMAIWTVFQGPKWRTDMERLCLATVAEHPALAGAYAVLGAIYDCRGAEEDACAMFEKARRLDPADNDIKFWYAAFIGVRGRYDEAIRLCEEVYAARGTNAPLFEMAMMYVGKRDYPRAVEVSRELCRRDQALWAKARLALCLAHLGDREETLALCDEILVAETADHHALEESGRALSLLGEMEKAVSCFKKATKLAPSIPYTWPLLASAHVSQSRFEEAVREYEQAVALDPAADPGWYVSLKDLYSRLGRMDDAMEACRRGVRFRPDHKTLWEALYGMLLARNRQEEARCAALSFTAAVPKDGRGHVGVIRLGQFLDNHDAPAPEWDRALARLEEIRAEQAENAPFLHALALCYMHAQRGGDLAKARTAIESADRLTSHRNAHVIATIAEVLLREGNAAEAAATIEEALALREGDPFMHRRHVKYARALLPGFISFASIDAVLGERDPAGDPELLAGFRTRGDDPRHAHLLRYLEGRVLQRAGMYVEAAVAFTGLRSDGERTPRIASAMAECLRDAGRAADADAVLRDALRDEAHDDRTCWNLWFGIGLNDLGRSPADLAADVPALESGDGSASGYGADMRWLLDAFANGAIRIDCGGEKDLVVDGVAWGKDRFFVGGRLGNGNTGYAIAKGLPAIYEGERWFPHQEGGWYRIPLPPGEYRVALHFIELCCVRSFDVRIEGEHVLSGYASQAEVGYGTPDVKSFDVLVEDGTLDVDFTSTLENAHITGIEIIPAASPR
ncbi:MAG TPA: hypothetical protein DCM87_12010, partial [Planctomycetes bacterium]|nr:hypothetical protein [Planctomycetota bacterium]